MTTVSPTPILTGILDSDFSKLLGRQIRFSDYSHTNNGVPIEHEGEIVGWCRDRNNDPCLVIQEARMTGYHLLDNERVVSMEFRLRVISLFSYSVVILPEQHQPGVPG